MALFVEFLILCIWFWQVVGTWRSATRRASEGLKNGPGIVKFLVILGTIATAINLLSNVQVYYALLDHAITPSVSKYELHVDDNRIVFVGQLASGVTNAISNELADHPGIETLIIESSGGYIFEGNQLAVLVSSHSLNVHARKICASSCLLVLAAGNLRSAAPGTGIGLHQARTIFDEGMESESIFMPVLLAGFPKDEFERSMSAPHDDMWYVDLRKAKTSGFLHYIGYMSDAEVAIEHDNRNQAAQLLITSPLFRELAEFYPEVYERVLDRFSSEVSIGMAPETLTEKGMQNPALNTFNKYNEINKINGGPGRT